jgi:hypothetical protein
MKPFKWRTINAGYRYVDGDAGCDLKGVGTMDNPYKTLRRAWDATTTKPSVIICRGYFSEDMADGNHAAAINGDYMGAATFDGNDTFLIYGFAHSNLIIKNCAPGSELFTVHVGSGLLAGAGRASAVSVGNANGVYGVLGSPVLLDNTGLYMGAIGGSTAVSGNIYSRPKSNPSYPISLSGYSTNSQTSITVCGCRIANRQKKVSTYAQTYFNSVLADFDMFVDDSYITLDGCLIAADCKWYYGSTEIVISGTTSQERQDSLINQATALGVTAFIGLANCVFSLQTKVELFNNPDKLDYTLKLTSDAIKGSGLYYGAMPAALDIPIMDSSAELKETWDENSAAGCVAVSGNAIAIDELSGLETGEILSKVIRFNPSEINMNAIFADFSSKFTGHNSYLWNDALLGLAYTSADELPIARYVVKGSIVYEGENYGDGAIMVVDVAGTFFTDTNSYSTVTELLDANISNVVYIRELPYIFVRIQSTDGLQQGATYFNYGNETITYRSRNIVSGESFVAENSVDTFTSSAGYEIGVMFDDTRVPASQWVPAQLFGDYFVWKQGGAIQLDTDGVPVSSGNYLSFQTIANGGYSDQLIKSILTTAYAQFRIVVKRFNIA